ncbi:glucose 1-dehydrogenase [Nocardioides aquiterrae]|uniref:SDR family oxidoreductase n=1 Tax=Nocardioides aquiterrae TaxID=203799 RepID=A0ABP4EZP4_9ACTN
MNGPTSGLPGGRLTDKVALVTGASRGIGAAIAERFAAEGARVVGMSRTAPAGAPVASVEHLAVDVAHDDEVRAAVEEVVARHGRLDVVVNNAAVEREGTVEETSLDVWTEVMEVNVRGVFLVSRHAMVHLRRTRGALINIASVDGFWAEPGLAAYSASKGAVLALTRAMALDHGPEGVRCNSICPSYVSTDMLEQFYDAQPDPQRARAQAAGVHALRRISSPGDIAGVAAFLASADAAFVTGQAIVVDGGLTAGRAFPLENVGV